MDIIAEEKDSRMAMLFVGASKRSHCVREGNREGCNIAND